jgi:hypothetical protein
VDDDIVWTPLRIHEQTGWLAVADNLRKFHQLPVPVINNPICLLGALQ